jgi:trk system potassium uptake protein TrkA
MERFAVIGLGHFGAEIARTLYNEGKEVIAIDTDKDCVQDAAEFSSQAICADALDKASLEAIGIKEVDAAIISLGERMDIITLAALYLKELNVSYIIVKALSDDHEKILRAIGIDEVIHPEKFAATRLGIRLSLFGASDYLPLWENYSVLAIQAPNCYIGQPILKMESGNLQVAAIQKQNKQVILTPRDDYVLQAGDLIVLIGENKQLDKFSRFIETQRT